MVESTSRGGAGERDHGPLQFQDLALELVDAAGVRRPGALRGEDFGLDLVEVVLDGVGDGQVVVDDVVGNGVQHRRGPLGQLFGVGFEVLAERAE
ncbi:hypothetical protein GCM10020000_46990 [Streptomyces olivoverticillatus]